jgi:hypothetical protein
MTEKVNNAELSAETKSAIKKYRKLMLLEKRVERATAELEELVAKVPQAEMNDYVEITTKMSK